MRLSGPRVSLPLLLAGSVLLASLGPTPVAFAAMPADLAASIDSALAARPAAQGFAIGLALIDARLVALSALSESGKAEAAAALAVEAAERALALQPPTRLRNAMSALATELQPFATGTIDGAAIAATREHLASLDDTAFQVGSDPTLNRLDAVEVLLEVASNLYGNSVSADGRLTDPETFVLARGVVTVASANFHSIERDLDARLQSAAAGLSSITTMIVGQFASDAADGLPRPDQVSGAVEFFLSYSAYF